MNQYRSLFHFSLLALAILICYGGTLNHTFHFDDQPNIIESENQHLTKLTWQGLKKAAYFDEGGNLDGPKLSRPVSRISLALNYYIHGLNVKGYHVVNIIIHILTACFLYLLFFEILKIYNTSNSGPQLDLKFLQDIALFGTFLWAMHPIQTQAVTYIVQRMTSMAAMFYILAFYVYIRGRCEQKMWRRLILFLLSLFFWIVGVFSKENAIFLPVAIIAFELLFFQINKKLIFTLGVLAILLGVLTTVFFIAVDKNIFETVTQSYQFRPYTMWERLLTEPRIIWRYIFLLLTPLQNFLTLESDILPSSGFFAPWTTFFSTVGIVLLTVGAWIIRRRLPLVSFAIIFYFINHLIESSFIPLELYFEHRNYLPSIFIYLTIAWYLVKGWQYYHSSNKIFLKWLIIFASVFILTSESVATLLRNDVWRDDISLFTDCIEKSPENLRSHGTLAVRYMELKDYDKTKKLLKTAENLYKKYPGRYQNNNIALVYYNAATLHEKLGNFEKSQRLFLRSLQLEGGYEGYVKYAKISFKINMYDQVEKAIYNALILAPNNKHKATLKNMLASNFFKQGKVEKAMEALKEGLAFDSLTIIRLNMINCYIKLGDLAAAKKILRYIQPDDNDLLLLVTRAILKEDKNNSDIYSQIATLIINRGVKYCSWLESMKKNDQFGIIGPDISSIENQILRAYRKYLDDQASTINKKKEVASACHISEKESQITPIPQQNSIDAGKEVL